MSGCAPETALAAALSLGAKGQYCFPCLEDKRPATPKGFKDAVSDANALRDLWRRYPGPLVGAPTGVGFDVLDIDAKHPEARDWWAENRPWLPETRTHRTRSGGLHLLFQTDPNRRCSAGKIARGIDVRACGGYIIWWPAAGLPVLCGAPLAPWPGWLDPPKIATPCEATARPAEWTEGLSRYAEAAIDAACRNIIGAPNGEQELTLVREAFSIGTLAGAGGAPGAFARDALHWAAHKVPSYDARRPWRPDELITKIDRAFDAGMARPREVRHG
jgi:hypothetical protein